MAVSSYAFDDFGRNIDPFTGKIKEASHKHAYTTDGNIIQPFAFTGYQEDAVSSLKFEQARFYDANTGRFQSEDNVKGVLNTPFTLNRYGYCWGNPVGLVDRDGNLPTWGKVLVTVGIVAVAGVAVVATGGLAAGYGLSKAMNLAYGKIRNTGGTCPNESGESIISYTQKDVAMPNLPEGSQWERNVLNSFSRGEASPTTYGGGTKLYRIGGNNGGFGA